MKKIILATVAAVFALPIHAADVQPSTTTTTTIPEGTEFQSTTTTTTTTGIPKVGSEQKMEETPPSEIPTTAPATAPVPEGAVEPVEPQKMETPQTEGPEEGEESEEDEFVPPSSLQDVDEEEDYL
jgi:hypothetical protein